MMRTKSHARAKSDLVSNYMPKNKGIIHRTCSECPKKKLLQRRAASQFEPAAVPPIAHEVLRSPGRPLDAATRSFMESRLSHDFSRVRSHTSPQAASPSIGPANDSYEQEAVRTADSVMQSSPSQRASANPRYDFSQVRVHDDARAAESARAVNALAYARGQHIVFGTGEYSPGTDAGQKLLVHELAHVVQQTSLSESPSMEMMIQRFGVGKCWSENHENWIRSEHILANQMLLDAYEKCYNLTPEAEMALAMHFKIIKQDTNFQNLWYSVLWGLYYMLQNNSYAFYICEFFDHNHCGKPDAKACTYGNDGVITLAYNWWFLPHNSPEKQAGTIIHEWAHNWVPNARGADETYCIDSSFLLPGELIRQPDAYMNFVLEFRLKTKDYCYM